MPNKRAARSEAEAEADIVDTIEPQGASVSETPGVETGGAPEGVEAGEMVVPAEVAEAFSDIDVTIEESVEIETSIEVHSPGETVPATGTYRPIGRETTLKQGDRFPAASMAFGWARMEEIDGTD